MLKTLAGFGAFVEEARVRLGELCDNMRETSSKLERKWCLSLKERDNILKKVKIWRHTLCHLLADAVTDEDVVCGLRLVGADLSARLRQLFAPPEKVRWFVTFPKWCHDSIESLKKDVIKLTVGTSEHFQVESKCRLQVSNPQDINSIDVSDEDTCVFVGDAYGRSIHEFDDFGELVSQCPLTDGGKNFCPQGICSLSKNILVVCGLELLKDERRLHFWASGRLFFLVQKKCPPFLEIQKAIDTKEKRNFGLCVNLTKTFLLLK